MPVFAIVLKEPNQQVLDRVDAEYPDSFNLSPTFSVARGGDLTESVAVKVGIKGENKARDAGGAAFLLQGSYSGYTTRSLWEWLERDESDF